MPLWFGDAIRDPIEPWAFTGPFASDNTTNDTKLVVHRTQGNSYPRTTYVSGGGVPHWTISHSGKTYQHYPINQYSRALLNLAGGVQTNLDQALQVELVGFTGKDMDPAQLAAFVRLKDWVVEQTGMPDIWLGGDPSDGPKLTRTEWDNGTGIIPHLKVPENNHTDTITRADWQKIRSAKMVDPTATFDKFADNTFHGWAVDLDDSDHPVAIHAYTHDDGVPARLVGNTETNIERLDVQRHFATTKRLIVGGRQGFSLKVDKLEGVHKVALYAINVKGTPGTNTKFYGVAEHTFTKPPAAPAPAPAPDKSGVVRAHLKAAAKSVAAAEAAL